MTKWTWWVTFSGKTTQLCSRRAGKCCLNDDPMNSCIKHFSFFWTSQVLLLLFANKKAYVWQGKRTSRCSFYLSLQTKPLAMKPPTPGEGGKSSRVLILGLTCTYLRILSEHDNVLWEFCMFIIISVASDLYTKTHMRTGLITGTS